jgi:hypothetical protein
LYRCIEAEVAAKAMAGAYHLLTIVHVFTRLLSAVLKPLYYHCYRWSDHVNCRYEASKPSK